MNQKTYFKFKNHEQLRIRTLLSMIAGLVLLIGIVKFWPEAKKELKKGLFFQRGEEVVEVEVISPTTQVAKPPPPPIPLPPVEVPDDVELVEEIMDFDTEIDYEEDAVEVETTTAAAQGNDPTRDVETAARPRRFVEPEYSPQAKKSNIRATIVLEVVVDEKGRVTDSRIVDRFLLDKKGKITKPVDKVGYGLEEAATQAAKSWVFSPAKKGGKAISSYATVTFRFGV